MRNERQQASLGGMVTPLAALVNRTPKKVRVLGGLEEQRCHSVQKERFFFDPKKSYH